MLFPIVGCEKKDPGLSSELRGTWELVQSQSTYYKRDGTVELEDIRKPTPAGSVTQVITSDSLVSRLALALGGSIQFRAGYTRQGNVLKVTAENNIGGGSFILSSYQLTIEELTEKRLVFRKEDFYPASQGGGLFTRGRTLYTR